MSALLALLTLALVQVVSPQADPERLIDELSGVRLDPGEIYRIRDLTLRRDALSVSFSRGVIAFLEPVEGRVTGAVFLGSGEVLMIPPDSVERAQIFKFTGSPILNERFNAAVLRFTDDTPGEILELMRQRAFEEVRADDLEALLPWEDNLGEQARLLNHRILADLLGGSDRPLFFAGLRGERLGWLSVSYDARSEEAVTVGGISDTGLDLWASFAGRSKSSDPKVSSPGTSDIDILGYEIDTTIDAGSRLSITARAEVRLLRSGERVLSFGLDRDLRLSEVSVDGAAVTFSQYPLSGTGPERRDPGFDQFILVLPAPSIEGEERTLEFRYAGSAQRPAGMGTFDQSARSRWYPTTGYQDAARFALTFHYPVDRRVVATGSPVAEWEQDGLRHAVWESGQEFFVAGFNYGDFAVESDLEGEVPVFVYANNRVEETYRALQDWMALEAEQVWRSIRSPFWFSGRRPPVDFRADYALFSTRRLAGRVLEDAASSVRFFSERFGPYPFQRLSVSQVPSGLSQSWPTLLYASTMSFFGREQLERLGMTEVRDLLGPEYDRAHEVAHQWFGNKVGWRNYRDRWMIEGLASYASLLYLEEEYGDVGPLMEGLSRRLLTRDPAGEAPNDHGPIWLGTRLATAEAPNGYVETVYPKATWVVHMLRMLMRDEVSGSDDRFFAMTRAFLDEYDGRTASTWDLKRTAEAFMNDRMDPRDTGNLDWFFDEWVFDTGVPAYALDYEAEPAEEGLLLRGRVRETGGWSGVMPVPLYAVMDDGALEFLGEVVVDGEAAFVYPMDRRPARVVADPYGTVLKRSSAL